MTTESGNVREQAKAFLERHREALITFSRKPLRELLGSAAVKAFIQNIEADEASAALMPPRRDMLVSEDSFWFCVMQLDEFGSVDWPNAIHEPFLHYLHHDLKRAANSLAHGRNLPPGMVVQWMDEDDAEDWDSSVAGESPLDQLMTMRQLPGPPVGFPGQGTGRGKGKAGRRGEPAGLMHFSIRLPDEPGEPRRRSKPEKRKVH